MVVMLRLKVFQIYLDPVNKFKEMIVEKVKCWFWICAAYFPMFILVSIMSFMTDNMMGSPNSRLV